MERSTGSGTIRAQRFLNQGLAITECCTANNESSARSITMAIPAGARGPSSMFRGTTSRSTHPIAYRNTARKMR